MLGSQINSDENATKSFKVPEVPYHAKIRAQTIQQLFILTGVKATYSNKSLDGSVCTPYFRFSFNVAKNGLHQTCMLLGLFGIDWLSESTDPESEGLIGVPYIEISKINDLFEPYQVGEQPQVTHSLKLDNLYSRQRLALANFLFSYQNSGDLEDRNNEKYDLSRIMLRVVDFVTQSLTSVDYLREKGFSFKMMPPPKPKPEAVATTKAPITTAFQTTVNESKKRLDVTEEATPRDNEPRII